MTRRGALDSNSDERTIFFMNNNPVKIAYLITGLNTGGAEITLEKIIENLSDRYETFVISILPVKEIGLRMIKHGVRVIDLDMKSKWDFMVIVRLYRILRKEKPFILHTFLSHANILGRLVGFMARIPIIVSSIRNERFGGRLRELMIAWTDRLSTFTTIVSQKAADKVIEKGIVPAHKSIVIRNGYDLKAFPVRNIPLRESVRKSLAISNETTLIVSVGSLTEQKGYPYLIDAMSHVVKKHPDIVLVIIGEGKDRESLEKKIKSDNLENTVKLLGVKQNVTDYYNAADLFVLASLWEGFSNVIVEAMACALPVIATDVGGAREALTDGVSGIIIEPKNAQVLAQKIGEMLELSKDAKRSFGDHARKTVEEKFSLQKMIDDYEKLYKKLLEPYS
ncbi:MAG: glycosyl transferase group 1 [Patescibacteria group bacterium]|nr:glycosyl transferase group 1 [Patescibacteria group bacterium]